MRFVTALERCSAVVSAVWAGHGRDSSYSKRKPCVTVSVGLCHAISMAISSPIPRADGDARARPAERCGLRWAGLVSVRFARCVPFLRRCVPWPSL